VIIKLYLLIVKFKVIIHPSTRPSVKLTLFVPPYHTNYMNVIFSYVKTASKHLHHISFSNNNLPWIYALIF